MIDSETKRALNLKERLNSQANEVFENLKTSAHSKVNKIIKNGK